MGQERQEVIDVHIAVSVKVRRAIGVETPQLKNEQQVVDAHDTRLVQVLRTAGCQGHADALQRIADLGRGAVNKHLIELPVQERRAEDR